MPRATVNINDTERFELRTLEEGYVVLRRMTYGQRLARTEISTRMQMESQGKGKGMKSELEMLNRKVAEFEFRHCVVSHNLEDENGEPLNFSNPKTLDALDPRVGEEIGTYIDKMNSFEEDEGN